jgi:hypothetical protein
MGVSRPKGAVVVAKSKAVREEKRDAWGEKATVVVARKHKRTSARGRGVTSRHRRREDTGRSPWPSIGMPLFVGRSGGLAGLSMLATVSLPQRG